MKAFFSRRVPFYLLSGSEVTDSNGFDAYAVDVDESTVQEAQKMRTIVTTMEAAFQNGAAPEECAQEEAEKLQELING